MSRASLIAAADSTLDARHGCFPRRPARRSARLPGRARHLPAARTPRLAPAVLAAVFAATPTRMPAPGLTVAAPLPAAAAAVISGYTHYISALQDAEQPAAKAAAILAGYATQPYLGHILAQITAYRQHGELAWGYLTPHIISVQVSGGGTEAVVRDCQDASSAWLVWVATGTVVPRSTGSPRTPLVAVLSRAKTGKWLMTLLAHLPGTCSRVPSPP